MTLEAFPPYPPGVFRWFLRWFEQLRARADQRSRQIQDGAGKGQRKLMAEARLLGAEVQQLGATVWEHIDAVPFAPKRTRFSPVRTQFYGHGAFMGAAPAMLANPRWRRILAFLMPDAFEAVRPTLASGDLASLIAMMENNPVLAAYGSMEAARAAGDDEHPNHLAGMEWDLFVDTALIQASERAQTSEAVHEVMEQVLDTALIAHAGALDTLQESMGISQYRDVRGTAKTQLGGVEVDSWLDYLGRALALATAEDFDAQVAAMSADPRSPSREACMLHTFEQPWPVEKVVAQYQAATGRELLSVVIDIKSLASTPAFLTLLVQHLNRRGVHVAAIGSFLLEEIDGVGAHPQTVLGTTLPGPREVQFFHMVGDLQKAHALGRLRAGQSVMFNGGSLLDHSTPSPATHMYSARLRVLRQLDQLREDLELEVGFYVQEGDCEAKAAAVLSDIVDAWPDTFTLGFAWGGLRDEAGLLACREPRLGYGSQRMLLLVGEARLWVLD